MQRRTALKWLVGAAGAVLGSLVVVPALISAASPVRRKPQAWRVVGPLRDFRLGEVVKTWIKQPAADYPRAQPPVRAVYVSLKSTSEVIVFSPTCTDLGCAVNFDQGSEFFYCPCHGGIFNKSGEPLAGPPPRPLYRYTTRVRNGVVEIDLSSVPAVA